MGRGLLTTTGRSRFAVALVLATLGVALAPTDAGAQDAVPARCRTVQWKLSESVGSEGPEGPMLLAYYYIWFNPTSWDRAKTDYPLLGRYSSDEGCVMRQHIRWAKQAGIDGFIVSWKSTDELNPRLQALAEIAEAEDFRLAVIYQGLDFYRDPLPVEQVKNDLEYFVDTFSEMPAFDLPGGPLVIWSGTWEFTRRSLGSVTEALRSRIRVLATEKSVADYEEVADLVDGEAYYWSSVNPATYPGYPQKLIDMSASVDRFGGFWIAPAAPGFDARLVGGTTIVPRLAGETLASSYSGAVESAPDAIGLISWNEFSENTHIEPSEDHGMRYLRAVADLRGASVQVNLEFDSSAPQGAADPGRLVVLGVTVAGALTLVTAVGARKRLTSSTPKPRKEL
jgi:hypothetical protein